MPKYRIILPTNLRPSPARYELTAAQLLAEYFKTDVEFIIRSNHKTADFLIDGMRWELKSPTGTGKYNIQHQVKAAAKQSSNVIIDARRSKMHIIKLRNELKRQFTYTKPINRLILIEKDKKIIELSR